MPINPTTLKALIDTQITNETVDFAITPAEVGGRMKDCVDYTTEQVGLKQNTLESGTNIKTINGESLLGSGNIEIGGGVLPYKTISFFLSISGTTPTPTYKQNDFPLETITMTIPLNAKLRIASTGSILNPTNTKVMATIFDIGGQMFFGVPDYSLLPFFLDIDLRRFDNNQSSTPSFSGVYFEIRIFNE